MITEDCFKVVVPDVTLVVDTPQIVDAISDCIDNDQTDKHNTQFDTFAEHEDLKGPDDASNPPTNSYNTRVWPYYNALKSTCFDSNPR